MGMLHPQFIIDYPMQIEKIHKRLDEIRSGAYDPDKTAWIDPTKILKDHDKAASQLRTILLGMLQTYAEGMSLLDKTSAARADLQALKEELLGPLGELSHEAGCLKLLDLVYYFADLAERGFSVPEHVFGPLREEVERITRVAVSLSAASRWRVAPLGGSGVAAMDCSSDAPDAASAIKGWHDAIPAAVRAAARKAAYNTKVIRFEQSRRAIKGHYPEFDLSEFTLERVFHTTNVDVINALSEEAYQCALSKGKAAAGIVSFDQAASDTKRSEKYHAEKAKNNGKPPPFKGDESCSFAAPQKDFPKKFEAHLKECESCRNWAYRVSQLQAAPVGAFPSTLTVVKRAAKLQEKGVKFLGRIDVADFTARRDAAKRAAKRKGAKGAAPTAKKAKK
jgi:hypothetical protein